MHDIKELYVGWVWANEKDRKRFEDLGLWGPMIYEKFKEKHWKKAGRERGKRGDFRHCWASDLSVLEKLDPDDRVHFTLLDGEDLEMYLESFTGYLEDRCTT
jgi:hypothetical protein